MNTASFSLWKHVTLAALGGILATAALPAMAETDTATVTINNQLGQALNLVAGNRESNTATTSPPSSIAAGTTSSSFTATSSGSTFTVNNYSEWKSTDGTEIVYINITQVWGNNACDYMSVTARGSGSNPPVVTNQDIHQGNCSRTFNVGVCVAGTTNANCPT